MKRIGYTSRWFLLAVGIVAVVVLWIRPGRLPAETRANFEWFSTLGFPDVKGCAYVRVATGGRGELISYVNDPPSNHYVKAFLLATNRSNFTVVAPNLCTRTFTWSTQTTPEYDRVGFAVLSLQNAARSELAKLSHPTETNDRNRVFEGGIPEEAEIFVLAWACWRQGLNSEAAQLYNEAKKLPSSRRKLGNKLSFLKKVTAHLNHAYGAGKELFSRQGDRNEDSSFREKLSVELSRFSMQQTVMGFGDLSISRASLLSQLESIGERYPKTEQRTNALELAEVLRKMIAEEQAHAKAEPKELEALPVDERVRELIFQLRDENVFRPDYGYSHDQADKLTNTPAHYLVQLGYTAVPQLVAALESNTLSRSVRYHRRFGASADIITVGDWARDILEEITGKDFSLAYPAAGNPARDWAATACRKNAEAWLADYQKKGEKQMMVEGVASGADDSIRQAELLFKRFPDGATASLMRGIRAASNSWVRKQLLEQIAKSGDETTPGFLKEETRNGPALESRVAAAVGLRGRGRQDEALAAMIQEWKNLATPSGNTPDDADDIIKYLAGCDSVEAISALETNLRKYPVELRFSVIEHLGDTNEWLFEFSERKSSPAALVAIEKCLVNSLEDTEEREDMSISWNGIAASDPRIGDVAGHYLAERWPERYSFDISASLKTRDRCRIECLNVWRKAHDLAALPLPTQPTTKVGRNEATKVTSVEWTKDSLPPEKSLATRVANLRGKLLHSDDIVNLITGFARQPQAGASGLEIAVNKDEDLTGVKLSLRLPPDKNSPPSQWNVSEHVALGGKTLEGSSGAGSLEAYTDSEYWSDFQAAIDKAIAAAPEIPFDIKVRLVAR